MGVKAFEIMNSDVATVNGDASVKEVAELLARKEVCGVVVEIDGELAGIITEGDLVDRVKKVHLPTIVNILDAIIPVAGERQYEEDLRKIAACTASEIMTADVITVDADAELSDVATVLSEQHIAMVPVLRDGEVVGSVDKSDVIRGMLQSNEA
ncbi:CBS domain-containing protein [Magnetofaba australis]|uniref:Putative CBS domain containing membrane protein n=1 Tax=Magnetofaba australis IT-1 TaxID=1434232 RepID=A0A1Y2K8G5_9PROT|nr:CBS domain-containing protein [Magnetofaba australis]OSM04966.1 putative CBS domain containing membrane protein [Magnetofaba australis IT-1]